MCYISCYFYLKIIAFNLKLKFLTIFYLFITYFWRKIKNIVALKGFILSGILECYIKSFCKIILWIITKEDKMAMKVCI